MYVCLGRKIPWICMYVAKFFFSQNIYMYVQVARYLGYACIQQKYLTKPIYVQVARYIGHACIQQNTSQKYTYVQVEKYIMKKKEQKESEQEKNKKKKNIEKKYNKGCLAKKQHACEKR